MPEFHLIAVILGIFIGLLMALTGAGGGILAVPLLVFGLGLTIVGAAPISMMAVALSAGLGAVLALRAGVLRYRAAAVMGASGLLLSQIGVWLAQRVPNRPLTVVFALVLLFVGSRMLWQAHHSAHSPAVTGQAKPRPACCLDPTEGRLRWTGQCARALIGTGMLAGFVSGLLGVGGGFIIVPALNRISELNMRAIVATSLGVLTIVSLGGLVSSLFISHVQWSVALPFCGGAVLGMLGGRQVAARFSGPRLQQVFALVACSVGFALAWRAVYGG